MRRYLAWFAFGAVMAATGIAWAQGTPGLDPDQRLRTDQIVSQFENSTSVIQYCYVEALGDGRGYTVGRAGFTSGTGDLLEVAQRYQGVVGDNPLTPFLPRLRVLARKESGSIRGLGGLPAAWKTACQDPQQRAQQDAVVDDEYYFPARRRWLRLKLKSALSLAAIYDAEIQHGGGSDPDGVPAMLRRAARKAKGTPRSGVTEARFLRVFLAVRRATLAHAHEPSTRKEWRESLPRVGAWRYLVKTGQWDLASPVRVRTRNYRFTLP